MLKLGPRQLERFADGLADRVARGELAAKTARNARIVLAGSIGHVPVGTSRLARRLSFRARHQPIGPPAAQPERRCHARL